MSVAPFRGPAHELEVARLRKMLKFCALADLDHAASQVSDLGREAIRVERLRRAAFGLIGEQDATPPANRFIHAPLGKRTASSARIPA